MKRRISITLDSELVRQVDKSINNLNFDSRSGFIEESIREYIRNSETAVILGGGSPEKLKINSKFKFLIPIIKDKTLLDFLFNRLSDFGKVFIIGQGETIDACFSRLKDKYGNIEIEYIEEKKELGNAKTLELAKNKLPQKFLILPIDQYYEFDFSDLMRKQDINYLIAKTYVTLAVGSMSTRKKFGSISMIGSTIIEHKEKLEGKKNLISAFAGACYKQIFDYIPKGEVKWVLQENVYPKLIKEGKMYGYLLNTQIFNIHTEQDIIKLRNYLRKKS